MNWTIKCDLCGAQQKFKDEKDIRYAKWKILAWIVNTGEPLCLCDKCEYKYTT